MIRRLIAITLMCSSGIVLAAVNIPEQGKQMKLTGVITGVISTAPNVEPSFKANYLKLDKPITFEGDGACGEITQGKIALNEFRLSRYQGKRVSVEGTVFCQQQYTGRYHMQDIKITILK